MNIYVIGLNSSMVLRVDAALPLLMVALFFIIIIVVVVYALDAYVVVYHDVFVVTFHRFPNVDFIICTFLISAFFSTMVNMSTKNATRVLLMFQLMTTTTTVWTFLMIIPKTKMSITQLINLQSSI